MVGIYQAASEHFVLKVDVLEAGKMGKCKDLREFDTIVMARRLGQSISKTTGVSSLQFSVSIKSGRRKEQW